MIDTTTKMVVATVPVGNLPAGVAVTPDGNHVYVVNSSVGAGSVSVIDTANNTVVATIPVGNSPVALAVTPDGKHVYVTNSSNTVSVIRTATNTVVDTIPVGNLPVGIAITPDGKHAYVLTSDVTNNFWVIDTATRTVVAMVPGGTTPISVAVTPDGKHAYVVNQKFPGPGTVSVLRTATNTVVATVPVGTTPFAVGIVPPPPGGPFLAFSVTALAIDFDGSASPIFNLHSQFTLSSTAPAINPVTQPVTLQVGTYSTTIPPGSFAKQPDGSFTFAGVVDGASLKAQITLTATLQYTFHAKATTGASLTGTVNPIYVTLNIGGASGDSGATSVTATFLP